MTVPVILAVSLSAAVAASSAVLWWRSNRRIRDLLGRIEELRVSTCSAGPDVPELAGEPATRDTLRPEVTADVLAGRTDEVDRIVAGHGEAGNVLHQIVLATHDRLDHTFGPAELAERLNISLRTLQRNLNSVLGCTPRELIVSLKMREAHRMLRRGDLNVTEVAMQLGFSSSSHFSRRFKRFYKTSPTEVQRGPSSTD